jgi:anti-sigma-K factor RskA
MAVEELTESQQDAQFTLAREAREWQSIEKEKDRQLQRDLKKLDIDGQIQFKKLEAQAATARLKASSRVDMWRHVLIALIKLPVLPFVALGVLLLELLKRPTVDSFEDFLNI